MNSDNVYQFRGDRASQVIQSWYPLIDLQNVSNVRQINDGISFQVGGVSYFCLNEFHDIHATQVNDARGRERSSQLCQNVSGNVLRIVK